MNESYSHSMTARASTRALEGVVVVDLTQVVSGAVTTMLMAEFGAEVIKVEPPQGEPYRNAGHPITTDAGTTNLNILRFSRGKKSVQLDLKSPSGKRVLADLIARADVLVENFRPGVLARLGFTRERLEELNPDLVYTTISGFGHDDLFPSPYRDRPAYAIVTEAMAGLTHLAGDGHGPPVWMGFAMADIFSGVLGFAGAALALGQRGRLGGGRRVDISMYDSSVFMNDLAMAAYSALGTVMGPGQYTLQSPWGPFVTTDGHVVVAVLAEHQWAALCDVVGRPELATDPRLASGRQRSEHHETLVEPAIGAWTGTRTKAECTEILLARGIPSAPVTTAADVAACPQVHAREMLVDVEDPVAGSLKLVGNPIKLDGAAPPESRRIPALGEHTDTVLADLLGLAPDAIGELAAAGAFGTARGS
jgi:CoA:oxalate CoA-transferase